MRPKRTPLEPDKIYHIYNHANGFELLFRKDNNYRYFLKRYHDYISPIADTFAYCLMPNHFHFVLRIKSENELIKYFYQKKKIPVTINPNDVEYKLLLKLVSKQFGNFFDAYAKAYNKMYKRKGKLFLEDYGRKIVEDDIYFRKLIHYVHYNPVHHGFVKDLRDWKYSSFEAFSSQKTTKLARKQVIEWFGDIDKFYEFHKQQIDKQMVLDLEKL